MSEDTSSTAAPLGPVSPFEQIRHASEDGGEYWSARELAPLLGYRRWEQFPGVIEKAKTACEASGQAIADHFRDTSKLIRAGKGAERRLVDWELSRYACYLVVQNADPAKPAVALGQTYFAVQTRRQEVAQAAADALADMTEDQARIYTRDELARHNRELASAAQGAGVREGRDFALFQDHGYRGLYGGEGARDIAARKGLARGQQILDYMGSTELAANLFRATQTRDKLIREGIQGREAANATHYAVGRAVRQTIADLGGTMPENLPTPPESIQQVQARERERIERERRGAYQPSLLDTPGGAPGGQEGEGAPSGSD